MGLVLFQYPVNLTILRGFLLNVPRHQDLSRKVLASVSTSCATIIKRARFLLIWGTMLFISVLLRVINPELGRCSFPSSKMKSLRWPLLLNQLFRVCVSAMYINLPLPLVTMLVATSETNP